MTQKKVYDKEFKIQAVKMGMEIGFSKAAKEQGINIDNIIFWRKGIFPLTLHVRARKAVCLIPHLIDT